MAACPTPVEADPHIFTHTQRIQRLRRNIVELVLTDYAESYGQMPPMRVSQSGYGAGDRDFPDHPNLLRVLVGQEEDEAAPSRLQRVVVLECEIDDMNPQIFGLLMDRLSQNQGAESTLACLLALTEEQGLQNTLATFEAPGEKVTAGLMSTDESPVLTA